MSDASNVERFCRRCKAHGFKAGIHSACPFKCCKCAECEKIAKHNEMARERARKRRADELAGPLLPSSSVDLTIEQVIQLANKNSGTEVAKKKPKKRCPQLPLKPVCCQLHDLLIQFFVNLPFQLF